jgi:hypothetical protein
MLGRKEICFEENQNGKESAENIKPSRELGFIRMLEVRNLHPVSVTDDTHC